MKMVILDGKFVNPGDVSWAPIEALGELTVYQRTEAHEVVARARDCEVIIANKVELTRDIIAQLPKLKLIALQSTGYNVVDAEACRAAGVRVANVPQYSTSLVAQHTFALLLELCDAVGLHNAAVHAGEWNAQNGFCFWKQPLSELCGKTLGIYGFGAIGKRVAALANAFEMRVIACSRSPFTHEFVQQVELDTLLTQSDILTLHCPLTAQTERLLNAETLAKMKSTALVLNTSRGGVIDEAALADALNNGRLAGAAVDVLSTEPPAPDNPLLHAKNCIVTPHTAWAAKETRERLVLEVAENIRSNLLLQQPRNLVI